ncbi:MAG TPA: glycosyltransferase family 4 protein, partial [Candidatus Paceibacterota bacterium]
QYLQKFSFIFTRKADYIININTQVRDYLISSGFDKNKIIINTPGIDYNYFKNLEVKKNENKYDATFLARLNPSKGIFDLIDIWNVVVSDVKNAKLAIIGGGSNEIKNKLKEKIIEKKLENNIDILGFLENNDSFSLIKNSNIFLFPSHEEGFGIAIAEAMACGVPVISWDLSVYDEIFENNIIQIKENNINMFAEDIIKLLKNENEKNNIIIKANNFVKKYDWEKISENHFEILNK